jgi:hypothetical protein
MSPRPIDLHGVRAGLARLDALVDTSPELRTPEAQARLYDWLVKEQRTMTPTRRKPTGDAKARARVQRLRERRKAQHWRTYELMLPPETAALLAELKPRGEALHTTIKRALQALRAQNGSGPAPMTAEPYDERKAALLARLRAMQAEGLSYQKIANQLNAEGEPTLTHKGRWQAGTVGKMLAQTEE